MPLMSFELFFFTLVFLTYLYIVPLIDVALLVIRASGIACIVEAIGTLLNFSKKVIFHR